MIYNNISLTFRIIQLNLLIHKIFFPVLTKEKSLLMAYALFVFVFADHLFAAFVHKNCYESARLYLQLLLELPDTDPRLNKKFADESMHAVIHFGLD